MTTLTIGISGHVQIELHKAVLDSDGNQVFDERGVPMVQEGTRRVVLPWFKNTFLDIGRENIPAEVNWLTWCQVGTNSQVPSPSDTGLYGFLASTNVIQATSSAAQGTEPYYGWLRNTYRFAAGDTAGNLNEVGIGWGPGPTPSEIVARTLTVDPTGTPTPVVPLPDEVLDVLYELRYYPMLGDVAGTVTLDGLVYDTLTRASTVNLDPQYRSIGFQMGVSTAADSNDFRAYDGELGTVLQTPSATETANIEGTPYNYTYGPNNYYIDMEAQCGANGWNLAAGIRSVTFTTRGGRFQTRFGRQGGGDETIPKTSGQTMALTYRLNWAGWIWDGTWQRGPDDDAPTSISQQWETNVAQTILRISWTDANSANRREELKVPDGTIFHMQDQNVANTDVWVEFTMDVATSWSEGTDWTEYQVTITDTGPGGAPPSGTVCTIRAMTP